MADRRALIEGLKNLDENIDPDLAEEFIYDRNPRKSARKPARAPEITERDDDETHEAPSLPQSVVAAAELSKFRSSPLTGVGRVPIGARVRTELAAALKRASLERQLKGTQPFAVQEILEEAIKLWLLKNGHPLK
jgi:hypothetical protein